LNNPKPYALHPKPSTLDPTFLGLDAVIGNYLVAIEAAGNGDTPRTLAVALLR